MIGVLVVEDERIVALALERALRRMGYLVTGIVDSGEEALRRIEQARPDLVLMDIRLRGPMDGIDAACQIQASYAVPVVYLTAYTDDETVRRATQSAAYGYVLKPFEERDLRVSVEMALARHQTEQKLYERERWLNATLQAIDAAVIVTDELWAVRLANDQAEEMTGWREDELWGPEVGSKIRLRDTHRRELFSALLKRAFRQRSIVRAHDCMLLRRDDKTRIVDCTVAPIIDGRQQLRGAAVVFRDAGTRRQAAALLEASAEHSRLLSKVVSEPLMMVDTHGIVSCCSRGAARLLGRTAEDILGHTVEEIGLLEISRLQDALKQLDDEMSRSPLQETDMLQADSYTPTISLLAKCVDGSLLDCEICASAAGSEAEMRTVVILLGKGAGVSH